VISRDSERILHEPLVVFGTGRCGSTVFHRVLSGHPDLAWMSRLTDDFPGRPGLNRLVMAGLDIPLLSNLIKWRVSAGECYGFWEHYIPGFRRPLKDLTEADYREEHQSVEAAFQKMLTRKRNRLLLKITGWPRIGLLGKLFPDSKFIHVYRDGRATAASTLKVSFWKGWGGPDEWRWGDLSDEHMSEWESHDRSFVALAAIQWKLLMDAAEAARASVPAERYLDIRYEDLCKDPVSIMKQVTDFCDLEWKPGFESAVEKFEPRNTNFKWKRDLGPEDRKVLEAVLDEYLLKYGYLT